MKITINGYIVPDDMKEVYDWFGMASCCPKDIKSVSESSSKEHLDVEIGTCYGGDIFAGSEMGTAIKSHASGSSIKITGLAASAASVIAMYAPCEMSPTAMLMVHNVSSSAQGDYHEMDKESSALKNANKAIAAAYSMKSGMSEEDALKMMDKETWLSAAQAKELGLIDGVMFESSSLIGSVGPGMIPQAVAKKTKEMLAEMKKSATNESNPGIDFARAKLNLIEKII